MCRMWRRQSFVLVATLTVLATACGGGGTEESRGTAGTTSTVEARSTTTARTGSDSTVAPPDRTSTTTTVPPASTSTPPPASTRPPAGTGVFGKVTAGPTCPVAQAENPCDPRPVDAEVEAQSPAGTVIATTHTDQAGAYDLQLAPATYTLVATTGSARLPRCTPTTVTVTRGGTVRANIDCDTGIR